MKWEDKDQEMYSGNKDIISMQNSDKDIQKKLSPQFYG